MQVQAAAAVLVLLGGTGQEDLQLWTSMKHGIVELAMRRTMKGVRLQDQHR